MMIKRIFILMLISVLLCTPFATIAGAADAPFILDGPATDTDSSVISIRYSDGEGNTFDCRVHSVYDPITENDIVFAEISRYSGSGGAITIPRTVMVDQTVVEVRRIASSLFKYNASITAVTLPDTLVSIENQAFMGTALEEIDIPASVKHVGSEAFAECASLNRVTIGNTELSYQYNSFPATTEMQYPNAPEQRICGDYLFTVKEGSGEATIVGYTGQGGHLDIPSTLTDINGTYTVTAIGRGAFRNSHTVFSATFPNTVTRIGESAFQECISLSAVSIPSSVKSIGHHAFYHCYGLSTVLLPEGLERLEGGTFYECMGLTKISLPSTLVSIGRIAPECNGFMSEFYRGKSDSPLISAGPVGSGCSIEFAWDSIIPENAFLGIDGLQQVTLPEGIITINANAFANCGDLTAVIIPATVTRMEDSCITNCPNVTIHGYGNSAAKTYAQENNLAFKALDSSGDLTPDGPNQPSPDGPNQPSPDGPNQPSPDGPNLPGGGSTPPGYGQATSGSCGYSLTWEYDKENATLTISGTGPMDDNVNVQWGSHASSVKTLVLPEGLTVIGSNAFYGFSSLTEVRIPDTVTRIGNLAFSGCTSLKKIILPESVVSLNMSTFSGCTAITSAGPIGSGADYEYGWKTAIPQNAFANLTNLTSVSFPEGVKEFGSMLFANCIKLMQVEIPATVTSFQPGGGGCTFTMWPNAKTAGPAGDGKDYNIEFHWTKEVPPNGLAYVNALKEVTLPDTIEVIGWNAFCYACFTSFDFPASLRVIEGFAFFRCEMWDGEIRIPQTVTQIGGEAFRYCKSLDVVWVDKGVERIDVLAFADCTELRRIHIPGTLWEIGYGCFFNCPNLHRGIPHQQWEDMYPDLYRPVAVASAATFARRSAPQQLWNTTSPDGCIVFGWTDVIPANAFGDANTLLSIELPETVTEIGEGAMAGCSSLRSVNIPASVQKMGAGVFTGADNLTSAGPAGTGREYSITFGWTESIPDNAFYAASSVANNIVLPDSVKSVGTGALDTDAVYLRELNIGQMAQGIDGKTVSVPVNATEEDILAAVDEEIRRLLAVHEGEYDYTCRLSENSCAIEIWLVSAPTQRASAIFTLLANLPPVIEEDPDDQKPDDLDLKLLEFLLMMYNRTYSVTAEAAEGGRIVIAENSVKYGKSTTVTLLPDKGWELVLAAVNGQEVNVIDNTITLMNIRGDQRITAVFRKIAWTNPFTDVPADADYVEALAFVCERRLFEGMSATLFAPDKTMNRAMFVTALGRLADIQESYAGSIRFDDVAEGMWYTPYVYWAQDNGIVQGYGNGTFGIDKEITLEQAVVILYRYAKYADVPVDTTSVLSEGGISDWAVEAMTWAVENGICTVEDPQAPISRAAIATLLYAFIQWQG